AATLVDMGGRMRMIVNEVDVVRPDQPMPKLPVAHAVWVPRPDFKRACEAWLLAGGAHHTSFSRAVAATELDDFAAMMGVEFIRIGHGTEPRALRNELRWNDAAYRSR
ncbi:MAG TPA: L-arabinose isomerase, partial [Anaeromyxobacteraceae bacterium]